MSDKTEYGFIPASPLSEIAGLREALGVESDPWKALAAKEAELAQNSSAFDGLAEQAQMLRRDLAEAEKRNAELQAAIENTPSLENVRLLARIAKERDAARADAASLRVALQGSLVLAQALFLERGTDPANNDNYNRIVDCLALSNPGARLLAELNRLRAELKFYAPQSKALKMDEPQPPEDNQTGDKTR